MAKPPAESTSRAALVAASALLDIAEAATHRRPPITPDDVVNRVVVAIANVKQLRPHQLDELGAFIAERLGVYGLDGQTDLPPLASTMADRDARHRAAVDAIVQDEEQPHPEVDPEALRAKVHGDG
jgi:hypothetical protein